MDPMEQNIPGDDETVDPVPEQEDGQQTPEEQEAPVRAEAQPVEPPRRDTTASPFANSPYVLQQPYPTGPIPQRPAMPKKRKEKSLKPWHLVLAGGVVVILMVISCAVTAAAVSRHYQQQNKNLVLSFDEKLEIMRRELETQSPENNSGNSVSGTPNTTPDGSLTPAQVYAQNVGSVVAINCTTTVNNFGQQGQATSSGSGFVLSEDGYIVTNYHVVEGQGTLKVVTSDSTTYEAKYIGGNEANDIALIKVEAEGLRPVTIGSSSDLIVGDQVAAIGNPLGELASTLTVGYISAKDRIVTTDGTQINMMQTDAAINPGNSGGPLFNMKGEVIGITSAKYSGTTTSGASIEGIGFAIPTDDVMGMLEDLQNYGYITGGYLGVSISDVSADASELYGLPKGVLVRNVVVGSCAEAAGIRVQDIIVSLGGYEITNTNDLSRALNKFKAGDTVTVTVYRSGAEQILTVTLDEKPQQSSQSDSTEDSGSSGMLPGNGSIEDWFGGFFGD